MWSQRDLDFTSSLNFERAAKHFLALHSLSLSRAFWFPAAPRCWFCWSELWTLAFSKLTRTREREHTRVHNACARMYIVCVYKKQEQRAAVFWERMGRARHRSMWRMDGEKWFVWCAGGERKGVLMELISLSLSLPLCFSLSARVPRHSIQRALCTPAIVKVKVYSCFELIGERQPTVSLSHLSPSNSKSSLCGGSLIAPSKNISLRNNQIKKIYWRVNFNSGASTSRYKSNWKASKCLKTCWSLVAINRQKVSCAMIRQCLVVLLYFKET